MFISRNRVQPFTTIRKAGLDLDMTETAALGVSYRGQFGCPRERLQPKLDVLF